MKRAWRSVNRVLLVLLLAGAAAALGLAFVTQAPNRLVSGVGVPLRVVLPAVAWPWWWWPVAGLVVAAWQRTSTGLQWLALLCATALLSGFVWLAGAHARLVADVAEAAGNSLGRTSLGGGFWVLVLLCWLAAADAVRRLGLALPGRSLLLAAVLLPVAWLAVSGQLDALSLFKEYENRQDVFVDALGRHAVIVLATLVPTLLIGVPLGVAAQRHPRFGAPLLALLNVVQTVPSIALFGLLMAPLAALAAAAPALGIAGIGLAPAVVALTLYSLLPIVQGTVTGLREVPGAVVLAAQGLGFTPRQVFWRVEVPLALPLLLSGLRLTAVQAIGLAVVAALVGAGGLGALMFQGLLSSALDLVLLGVLPVVAMAVVADALFAVLAGWAQRAQVSRRPQP